MDEKTCTDEKTYIHEGIEVRLTGRKASKKRKRSSSKGDLMLFEIKPLDIKIDWCVWVDLEELYEVEDV